MPEEMPELMEQLIELADTGAPGSRVDAELAIRIGSGRRRRRRFAMGTAAAVLALTAGGLAALPAVGHETQAAPAMPASQPVTDGTENVGTNAMFAAGTMPQDSRDPDKYVPAMGSDPLVMEAGFGWLPDWAVRRSSGIRYQSGFTGGINTTVTGSSGLQLQLAPPGATPQLPAGAKLQQAEPVNGREAYWVTDPTAKSAPQLQWRTDTGRWAQLIGIQVPDQDPQAVLHKVAANVRPVATQVALPVWFSDLPVDFKLSSTTLLQPNAGSGAPWSLQLVFTHGAGRISMMIEPIPPAQGPATALPDITPAAPPGPQTCDIGNGLQICFNTWQADQMMAEIGSDRSYLLTHFHLIGTDQSAWTTWVQR